LLAAGAEVIARTAFLPRDREHAQARPPRRQQRARNASRAQATSPVARAAPAARTPRHASHAHATPARAPLLAAYSLRHARARRYSRASAWLLARAQAGGRWLW